MFLLKKSDFINLCKSMGKDPEFEKLRAEVLSILKKQAKSEGAEDKKSIQKALDEMDNAYKYFDESDFIVKSGYPVGTIREWKGRKYIKVAPNKWKPKYDSESKGAKNSITRLMNQVDNCKNVEELMNLVMANKQRFTDANGNHLPIVDKLRAAADKKNEELSNGVSKPAEEKKTPKAEKKKSFKKEMNELYDAQDAAWEGFNSGSEIKATPENSKKFYERVKKFVDDNNIKLSQKHYAEIEDNNGHSFNEALALAGAYGPDMKEKALKGNKKASEKYKGTRLDLSQIDEFKNEESESEKHQNRSDAMKGNKNAKKDGVEKEESKKDIKDMSDKDLDNAISERNKKIKELSDKNSELYEKNNGFGADGAEGKDYEDWLSNHREINKLQDESAKMSIERGKRKSANSKEEPKKFVNSYGEATDREITSAAYERAERRRMKDVENFMGIKRTKKSLFDEQDLFESASIEETVHNVLSSMNF